ncbi:hypothetical protein Tco_1233268 [Tanacetum coccineum]
MMNLEDNFTFGDQFFIDKSLEDEQGKANVDTKVESMVTVPIQQASSSAPTLSTHVIDLSPPKPVSPPLSSRVLALEKICANFEKRHKLQNKTVQALSSRVFTLENHDLYSKIYNYVNETVKESVHNALQAPFEQHVDDIPIPNVEHLSNLEDTGVAHLPKIKTRPDWLKPVPEEDTPNELEPNWVIPSNDLPERENNWAN